MKPNHSPPESEHALRHPTPWPKPSSAARRPPVRPRAYGRVWLASLPLLLASFHAPAGDLLEVYHQAQARDPIYRAAVYALQAARERVPQARAALLPAVSLVGAASRQAGQVSFNELAPVARDVHNRSWNLQLTQPLWRATASAALDQAGQQELLAEAQFRLAEQDLILRTAQAYLDVLVAQEAEHVAHLQISAMEQQRSLARRTFEGGTGTVTDVHEAQSRLDLSRAQAVVAGNELQNKLAELTRILGVSHARLAGLRADSPLPRIQPEAAQPWLDSAREQSIQVRIAQATLDVADREIAKSQAAHLPTLEMTASYGSNFSSGSTTSPSDVSVRSRAAQVGVSLNIPLYAGGGVQARVREVLALKGKAEEDLEAARRLAAAQARQAFAGVVNGAAQVQALGSAMVSSKSSLDANKVGYLVGTRINMEVLNAEQQLYATQRDWHKARAEALIQGLRLKAANATLSEADLTAINDMLETTQP